jgi:hypothetical protein
MTRGVEDEAEKQPSPSDLIILDHISTLIYRLASRNREKLGFYLSPSANYSFRRTITAFSKHS